MCHFQGTLFGEIRGPRHVPPHGTKHACRGLACSMASSLERRCSDIGMGDVLGYKRTA